MKFRLDTSALDDQEYMNPQVDAPFPVDSAVSNVANAV